MQKDKTDTQTNGYFNSILNNNPWKTLQFSDSFYKKMKQ